MTMTDEARKKRNAYMRKWRKANRERVKAYNRIHWERKASEDRRNEKENNAT